jgi:hypothetical protein
LDPYACKIAFLTGAAAMLWYREKEADLSLDQELNNSNNNKPKGARPKPRKQKTTNNNLWSCGVCHASESKIV